MKKYSGKVYSQIVKLTRTVLLLLFLTIFLFISFLNHQEFKNSSPFDVVISDVKPYSVNISWKTLKEVPTYVKVDNEKQLFGDGTPLTFHQVNISGLKELTEYNFIISDGNSEWKKPLIQNSKELKNIVKKDFSFITTKLSDEISLPFLMEISSNPDELVYVSLHNTLTGMDSKVKSVKTNQFGNSLIDRNSFNLNWKEGEFVVNVYPAITFNTNLSQSISVYASEINCNLNAPPQTIDGVTREQFANYATRWVDGRGKNYAFECFNDVVYRSRMAGVDPAFSLTVWLNESSASNYTQNIKQYGHIEDFGIHGLSSVPAQNFNAQITHFLKMTHKVTCSGLSSWEAWGNMYRFGSCNSGNPAQRNSGIDYYKKTENLYRWITNGKRLPATVTGLPIPVDIGHDLGNWSPLAEPVCCVAQFEEKEDLVGLYNEDILELSCEELWSIKENENLNIKGYVQIEDIEKNDCEIEFQSSCCRVGNEILWYPSKYCTFVIEGIDNSSSCEQYTNQKACFFREERFQWLPKGIGEDMVINIDSEVACNLRNDVSKHSIKLKKGVNFIGFDFTPSYNQDVLYASRLMSIYPQLSLIGSYKDNEWSQLISKSNSYLFTGLDFYFEQSQGYLFIVDQDLTIELNGWKNSETSTPTLDEGWNFLLSDAVNLEKNIDRLGTWSQEKESLSYDIDREYEDVLGVKTESSKYQAVFMLKKQ